MDGILGKIAAESFKIISMKNISHKMNILVTGASGFLGFHVIKELQERGYTNLIAPRSSEYDLRNQEHLDSLFSANPIDVVIHLAAVVGGIGANQNNPGAFFYDNAIMGIQLLEAARRYSVKKTVIVGTVCSYPKFATVPFKESDLWSGYPEETNAPYGLAKKMLLVQSQAYRDQYGSNMIYLLPVNLYGPKDNFDPESSHVIPALIKKFVEAKDLGNSEIDVWGTGKATRDFIYVSDAAEAIVTAMERYNGPAPVNLGSGMEISISDLANMIKTAVDSDAKIKFDSSKPDGQPRRSLDTSLAQKEFGFVAKTNFTEGIKETVNWYLKNR